MTPLCVYENYPKWKCMSSFLNNLQVRQGSGLFGLLFAVFSCQGQCIHRVLQVYHLCLKGLVANPLHCTRGKCLCVCVCVCGCSISLHISFHISSKFHVSFHFNVWTSMESMSWTEYVLLASELNVVFSDILRPCCHCMSFFSSHILPCVSSSVGSFTGWHT